MFPQREGKIAYQTAQILPMMESKALDLQRMNSPFLVDTFDAIMAVYRLDVNMPEINLRFSLA